MANMSKCNKNKTLSDLSHQMGFDGSGGCLKTRTTIHNSSSYFTLPDVKSSVFIVFTDNPGSRNYILQV